MKRILISQQKECMIGRIRNHVKYVICRRLKNEDVLTTEDTHLQLHRYLNPLSPGMKPYIICFFKYITIYGYEILMHCDDDDSFVECS